jgi:hypothetical protein
MALTSSEYLAKLHALQGKPPGKFSETRHPQQPSNPSIPSFEGFEGNSGRRLFKNQDSPAMHSGRGCERDFAVLRLRCPDHVEPADWRQAVEDGGRFLATWGDQAEALGWSSRDLFGLHTIPDHPKPSYRRLSRYDGTGLIWLLRGRPVVALTEITAAIQNPTGAIVTYRKLNKPTLGPVGDSLDDVQ